jgi:hypothetical protein
MSTTFVLEHGDSPKFCLSSKMNHDKSCLARKRTITLHVWELDRTFPNFTTVAGFKFELAIRGRVIIVFSSL